MTKASMMKQIRTRNEKGRTKMRKRAINKDKNIESNHKEKKGGSDKDRNKRGHNTKGKESQMRTTSKKLNTKLDNRRCKHEKERTQRDALDKKQIANTPQGQHNAQSTFRRACVHTTLYPILLSGQHNARIFCQAYVPALPFSTPSACPRRYPVSVQSGQAFARRGRLVAGRLCFRELLDLAIDAHGRREVQPFLLPRQHLA